MITFVEHDDQGNIFHVCQIDTTEGPDAPPPIPEPVNESTNTKQRDAARVTRAKQRADRKARIDQMIIDRENATRADLEALAVDKPMIILPEDSDLPHPETHKVDLSTGNIVELSPEDIQVRLENIETATTS